MVLRGMLVGAVTLGVAVGMMGGCSDEPGNLDGGNTSPTSTTTGTTPTSTGTTPTNPPDSSTPDSSTPDSSTPDSSTPDGSTGDASDGATAPTFTMVYNTIINGTCTGCHGQNGSSGLSMNTKAAAYANLVTNGNTNNCGGVTKRVTANNPAQSSLYLKVSSASANVNNCGQRMPRGGNALPAAQVTMIQQWIAAGALDN